MQAELTASSSWLWGSGAAGPTAGDALCSLEKEMIPSLCMVGSKDQALPVVSGDGDNVKFRKFHFNVNIIFFPMWMAKQGMELPVEFVVFSSLDTSKSTRACSWASALPGPALRAGTEVTEVSPAPVTLRSLHSHAYPWIWCPCSVLCAGRKELCPQP